MGIVSGGLGLLFSPWGKRLLALAAAAGLIVGGYWLIYSRGHDTATLQHARDRLEQERTERARSDEIEERVEDADQDSPRTDDDLLDCLRNGTCP